jgi:uncharacterized protein (DUF433 family)
MMSKTTPHLLTRNEAAQLSGASMATVNKAIEQGVLATRAIGRASLIDARDIAALVLFAGISFGLPVKDKRRLSGWLRTAPLGAEQMLGPGVVVRKTEDLDKAARRATRYAELKQRFYEKNPDRQGGEPVIRGTRVPIRGLAKQIENGVSMEELTQDYDYLEPEAFEFAVLWAKANPRRGRPTKARTAERGPEPAARRELIEQRRLRRETVAGVA